MADSGSPKPFAIAAIVVLAVCCLSSCSASSSYATIFAAALSAVGSAAQETPTGRKRATPAGQPVGTE